MTCQIKCRVLDLEIVRSGGKMFGTEKRGLQKTAHHKLSPLTWVIIFRLRLEPYSSPQILCCWFQMRRRRSFKEYDIKSGSLRCLTFICMQSFLCVPHILKHAHPLLTPTSNMCVWLTLLYHNNQDCPCHGLCSLGDIHVKAAAEHLSHREGKVGWPIFKITGIQMWGTSAWYFVVLQAFPQSPQLCEMSNYRVNY